MVILRSISRNYLNQLGVLVQRLLLVYVAYFFARLVFFIYNHQFFASTGVLGFLKNAFLALRFDSFSIFATNSLFILLSALPLPVQNRKWYRLSLWILFGLSNFIGLAFNFIDVAYYPFTRKRSTSEIFDQLGGQTDMGKLLPQFLADFWLVVVIALLCFSLLMRWYTRIRLQEVNYRQGNWQQWLTIVGWFLFSIGISTLAIRGGWQRIPIDMVNAGAVTESNEVPLVLNTPFSILKTMEQKGVEEYQFFSRTEAFKALPTLHCFRDSAFSNKNVVVIILESFSKEYTALGRTGKSLTPFLDSLCGVSFVCVNGYSNGTKSIEGIPAILCSMPSWMENPFINSPYANNRQESFASLLGKEGYSSVFYHGGINGTMNFDSWAVAAGYQHYYGMNEYNDKRDFDQHWGITDGPFLQKVAEEMNRQKKPFHAAVFTLSSHHPYFVPPPYDQALPQGPYENSQSIRYADDALRKFFTKIKQYPWFKNTLFVLSADHGSLSEHPWFVTTIGNESIPILFYDPAHPKQTVYTKSFSQVDILPSALRLMGYNKPFPAFGRPIYDSLPHASLLYVNSVHYYFGDTMMYRFNDGQLNAVNYFVQDSSLMRSVNGLYPQAEAAATRYCRLLLQRYHHALIVDSLR